MRLWDRAQIDLLCEKYPTMDTWDLSVILNMTVKQVTRKAQSIGLKKDRKLLIALRRTGAIRAAKRPLVTALREAGEYLRENDRDMALSTINKALKEESQCCTQS
jgi:hypothetical protein